MQIFKYKINLVKNLNVNKIITKKTTCFLEPSFTSHSFARLREVYKIITILFLGTFFQNKFLFPIDKHPAPTRPRDPQYGEII
jgi:hypothetical protein